MPFICCIDITFVIASYITLVLVANLCVMTTCCTRHLHAPLIKPASNKGNCFCRLIPSADVDSWLSPTCKQALVLPDGTMNDYTILLCLDDVSPSSKKETLALASTQIQHEWYAVC